MTDDVLADAMESLGVSPGTYCAKCLRTFREHVDPRMDCGEFTPCVDAPADDDGR